MATDELANERKWDPTVMDNASIAAGEDLNDVPDEIVLPMAEWWNKWYLKAGHKRLGRILIQIYKESNKKQGKSNNNVALDPKTGKFSQVADE